MCCFCLSTHHMTFICVDLTFGCCISPLDYNGPHLLSYIIYEQQMFMAHSSGGQEFKVKYQQIQCLVRVGALLYRQYLLAATLSSDGTNKLH